MPPTEAHQQRSILTGTAAAILLLLAALPIAWLAWPAPVPVPPPDADRIDGAFALTDQRGRPVTDETFRGRWMLVTFGFTHCPDVCPSTLADLARTLQALGAAADQVQPVFITLDPERDTPALLSGYLAHFDPRIVGLSGSAAQTRRAAASYDLHYERVEVGASYAIDHGTGVYLMQPDGRFAAHFPRTSTPEVIAREIARRLNASAPT